eukprot:Lankesteria_metandrocarpae@DN5068_c1_g3_i2.p1
MCKAAEYSKSVTSSEAVHSQYGVIPPILTALNGLHEAPTDENDATTNSSTRTSLQSVQSFYSGDASVRTSVNSDCSSVGYGFNVSQSVKTCTDVVAARGVHGGESNAGTALQHSTCTTQNIRSNCGDTSTGVCSADPLLLSGASIGYRINTIDQMTTGHGVSALLPDLGHRSTTDNRQLISNGNVNSSVSGTGTGSGRGNLSVQINAEYSNAVAEQMRPRTLCTIAVGTRGCAAGGSSAAEIVGVIDRRCPLRRVRSLGCLSEEIIVPGRGCGSCIIGGDGDTNYENNAPPVMRRPPVDDNILRSDVQTMIFPSSLYSSPVTRQCAFGRSGALLVKHRKSQKASTYSTVCTIEVHQYCAVTIHETSEHRRA